MVGFFKSRRARDVKKSFRFVGKSGLLEAVLLIKEFNESTERLSTVDFDSLERG